MISSYPLLVSIALVALYLGILLLVAEGLNRLYATDGEITRKVVHIGSGNVILLAWWLQIPAWVGVSAAIIAAIIALVSYFLPILPSLNSVGRRSWGTFFYAVSFGVLVPWFWSIDRPQYAAIGILIMALGDGFAALVGKNYGKHRYDILGSQKSLEGSFTMAIISFSIAFVLLASVSGVSVTIGGISLAVSIGATVLESFSKLGIDNLTVPLGSASIAYYLSQVWL